jgi:hypothetical protein
MKTGDLIHAKMIAAAPGTRPARTSRPRVRIAAMSSAVAAVSGPSAVGGGVEEVAATIRVKHAPAIRHHHRNLLATEPTTMLPANQRLAYRTLLQTVP